MKANFTCMLTLDVPGTGLAWFWLEGFFAGCGIIVISSFIFRGFSNVAVSGRVT